MADKLTKEARAEAKLTAKKQLYARLDQLELSLNNSGYQLIAGVDEAGRGPLAGPVVAAACILDRKKPIYGINDSKKLSPRQRDQLYDQIIAQALAFSVSASGPERIDQINILEATREAMLEAVSGLSLKPDMLLIDAVRLPIDIAQRSIIKGDANSNSIAAASILAKVSRDRLMAEYDLIYPGYNFSQHKGYGTSDHRERLEKLGPSPIHRLSFLKKFSFGHAGQKGSTEIGRIAEDAVANHLKKQGYTILAQNYSLANFGELDLVVMKSGRVEIIEVKARTDLAQGQDYEWSLSWQKKARLERLGEYFCLSRGYDAKQRRVLAALCLVGSDLEVEKISFVEL